MKLFEAPSLTKPIWALFCLHDVTAESVGALTDHFVNTFVCKNVAEAYDFVAML